MHGLPIVLRLRDGDRHAEAERDREVEAERVEALAQQRGRDELALARALAREERGRDPARERQAGVVVAHAAALERRVPARRRQQARDARARPEARDVVGGAVAVGPLEPVAADRPVDEARVAREQALGIEPEPRERRPSRTLVTKTSARSISSSASARPASVREVDHDAALAAVVHLEGRVERAGRRRASPRSARRVADAGRLDLDDVGAPVGEDAAGRGPGDPDSELHHPHACHGPHRSSSSLRPPTLSEAAVLLHVRRAGRRGRLEGDARGPRASGARAARAMGGEERLAKHRAAGQARRARAHRPPRSTRAPSRSSARSSAARRAGRRDRAWARGGSTAGR